MLERLFQLHAHQTTVRTEFLGGATTFVTMAYIIVVNPAILRFAGLPTGPSTVATILAATFGSQLMGLYANRPIAVAVAGSGTSRPVNSMSSLPFSCNSKRW